MSSLGIFNKETKTYQKIAGEAKAAVVDTAMSDTSTSPVQNKVIKKYVDDLEGKIAVNLLNPILETVTRNGITYTQNVDANGNPDGTYTINGTSIKDEWISFAKTTLNPGKYKFIATENNVEVSNLCVALESTLIAIPGNIFTIQSESVCDIGLSTYSETFNNVLIKPMMTPTPLPL